MTPIRLLLFAALIICSLGGLSGCVQVDGIWYFVFDVDALSECTSTTTHNYADAEVPAPADPPDSPWTMTDTYDSSPSSSFGQIVYLDDGSAILVIDQLTYPGVETAGTWVFSWEDYSETTSSETHEDGYSYTNDERDSSSTTMTMTIVGGSASGPVVWRSTDERTWSETDQWDPAEVNLFDTQIPAGNYLDDPNGGSVTNLPDEADCSGSQCELQVTSTCSSDGTFTATETQYATQDVFDAVDTAGQP